MNTTTHVIKFDSCVISSIGFLNLMGIFYSPFYYEKLFKAETDRLSDEFEKNVIPEEFYKMGFNIRVDIGKKNQLQIDSIAWNSNVFCNYSAYQKQLIDIDFYVIGTSDY